MPTATTAAVSFAPSAAASASTPSAFTQGRRAANAANAHRKSGSIRTSGWKSKVFAFLSGR